MTDYDIKYTDTNKTPIPVQSDTELVEVLDLTLFGRGYLEYGEQLNENLLRLLENFACPESEAADETPDLTIVNDNVLSQPTEGQLWYNTTRKRLYNYNGTAWVSLRANGDYGAMWGQMVHGQQLPQPVSSTGYVFPYSECIWVVAPAGHAGRFDYHYCTTDNDARVKMKYHLIGNGSVLTEGIVNYLIIGIRGHVNSDGDYEYTFPSPTPSPTPSVGASPTPTPTTPVTATPSPTASSSVPAPTVSATRTPTPTPTRTMTPTPTHSPAPILTEDGIDIYDSTDGGNYNVALAICRIEDFEEYGDYGRDCSGSYGMCPEGSCVPRPGTYAPGGTLFGQALGITITGGTPPYTVRVKNFTCEDGPTALGEECMFFANGPAINTFPSGTVYTGVISTSGGSITGLTIEGVCGYDAIHVNGDFDIEVTDFAGTIVTITKSWIYDRNTTSTL